MEKGEVRETITRSLQKLDLNPNSDSPKSKGNNPSAFQLSILPLEKARPPTLVSLCLGVIGRHFEDIIEDLGEIAANFPADIKMAMAAIAKRRKLLNDDVIISLADSSWRILDLSSSDVSDFGLSRIAAICKFIRAVDISRCSKITSLGVYELVQHCRSLEILRCGGCPRSDNTARRCLGILKPSLEDVEGDLEPASKEEKSPGTTSQIIPNLDEVKFLLTQMCDTASIAEFELKLGGFRLYVTRKLEAKSEPPPPPVSVSVPVSVSTPDRAPDQNGTVSAPSLAISKSVPSSGGIRTLLDKAADEGLVIIQSPRVGYFRRSRTIKGKRAPPSCKEKQIVKEGQVLCYIEQLGGEIPIESDISGEVVKILHEDGDPVGYGDSLIAILPSFPGIKKLQ